jgi:PAS domain S-box-containing protein
MANDGRAAELERALKANRDLAALLQDSEERFRQVTDSIDEVFWMTDPRKDRMLFISKAYERIWGRTCQSVLERPMSFVESIHPVDRAAVIAAFPKQKDGSYDIEYRIVRSDGAIRWIRDKAFPIRDSAGEITRIVGVAQDITTNKDSEERFRQVTDTIDEVFWMTDPRKSAMLFISKAYERVWGRSCQSVIERPMSFIESIHPLDRDAVLAAFPKQTQGTYDIEYRIVRSDGAIRWISDRAFPVRDASGEIYRVVGVAQDITENKDLIRDLNEEKRRTERLLENILPKSIIGALKGQEDKSVEQPAIAQRIDHATVLFADIVGFTAFSQSLEAEVVVDQLNKIVHVFDGLAEKHGVEKIKTIGDCYMLAGGVPNQQDDHALRVANAAIEMLSELAKLNRAQGQSFQIRVGIHSGPLVAGVIGTKKYVYDIWGDTVNTASRMQSTGVPGEIQVSDSTHALLGDRYRFEDRGLVAVKGKGEVRAYLLKGPASG